MYGSPSMSKDLNLPFPVSPYKQAKEDPDVRRQKHQPHVSSSGLLRYRSAPGNFLGEVCDETVAAESMFARFMGPDLRDREKQHQSSTDHEVAVTGEFPSSDPPHMFFHSPLQHHQHQMSNSISPVGSGPVDREASTGGGVGNLVRHSSSPVGFLSHSNSFKAESVNAGWPTWLASAAGEAIKGWVPRKASSFQKLDKIGQGTYSSVYKARDRETGRIVALKRVRFASNDPESVRFMAREIIVLRRLDHINVIKLEGLITAHSSNSLYLVLEYMEHDLAGLVATSSIKFSEPQIKCYMQQLLRGLEHCHSRGVLHRDIKGSNLVIGNNGILKLADFGLATFYSPKERRPSTNRVVTLWYRPPELLLGCTNYDVGVDLWSSGCILGEILAGKPILPGRTEVEQLHKIFRLCGSPSLDYWQRSRYSREAIFKSSHHYRRCIKETFEGASSTTLALLETLLAIEPENRGTSSSALLSEFFTTQPYACHPSSLPKYPPTKELDVKRQDGEARRQAAASLKGHGSESMGLERYGKQNHKSSNKTYKPTDDALSAFLKLSRNGTMQNGSTLRRSVSIDYDGNLSFQSLEGEKLSNARGLRNERSLGHHVNVSHSSDSIGMSGSMNFYSQDNFRNSQQSEHGNAYNQGGDGLSSNKKEKRGVVKEASSDYYGKHNRMHHTGSLIPKDWRNAQRTGATQKTKKSHNG